MLVLNWRSQVSCRAFPKHWCCQPFTQDSLYNQRPFQPPLVVLTIIYEFAADRSGTPRRKIRDADPFGLGLSACPRHNRKARRARYYRCRFRTGDRLIRTSVKSRRRKLLIRQIV
jgi:hypothetical protein